MTAPSDGSKPQIRHDVPTPARMYDYCLGGKDNFPVDRAAVLAVHKQFPEGVHEARNNRLFLYRLVRFLARDAGIRQFLDMGSGLPTQANVHQVAQRFQPDARVVYVDNDPIVLSHGRALLADDRTTTVIAADMTEPERILGDPETRKLIDFSEPAAALFLSIGHSIVDDQKLRSMLETVWAALAPGSYLGFSQVCGIDRATVEEGNEMTKRLGLSWRNRTVEDVTELLRGLEPAETIEPGLVQVVEWRPDPDQPTLAHVDEPLRPYLESPLENQRSMECGVVFRKL
ncbi:SAM-dependent methyltransferase [Micromonospora sp. WMMD1102]|uniref:SAM-dependent methyltransferase n=1 Tax=Micromonospora sp. WMMD1102 TaxID=3016105 RepID=UPI00241579E5|nr:SAM-dependent methyltransferase [Micromonospora sp. WMMD1102]MDG4791796.1 SAM-dependent methyltransferase [Micromonospora sp. WMMD1102]